MTTFELFEFVSMVASQDIVLYQNLITLIDKVVKENRQWNNVILDKLLIIFCLLMVVLGVFAILFIFFALPKEPTTVATKATPRKARTLKDASFFNKCCALLTALGIFLAAISALWSTYETRRANTINEERFEIEIQKLKEK